jgi:hypothetical protein
MDTADAAGDEDGQSGADTHPQACGDGGSAPGFSGGDDGEIAEVDFLDAFVCGEGFEFLRFESDADGSVVQCECGGDGALFADDVLAAAGDFEIARLGQAMSNDDGLEGDDGASFTPCARDLVGVLEREGKEGIQGSSSGKEWSLGGRLLAPAKERAAGAGG